MEKKQWSPELMETVSDWLDDCFGYDWDTFEPPC